MRNYFKSLYLSFYVNFLHYKKVVHNFPFKISCIYPPYLHIQNTINYVPFSNKEFLVSVFATWCQRSLICISSLDIVWVSSSRIFAFFFNVISKFNNSSSFVCKNSCFSSKICLSSFWFFYFLQVKCFHVSKQKHVPPLL